VIDYLALLVLAFSDAKAESSSQPAAIKKPALAI
jgi:hypothetical protein